MLFRSVPQSCLPEMKQEGTSTGAFNAELQTWSGRTIDVPSCFISGKQDWGTYQVPGVFEAMQAKACTNMILCHLVDGAGHWVEQEQPAEVSRLLLAFLQAARTQNRENNPMQSRVPDN